MGRNKQPFLAPVRSDKVDHACPLCYGVMEGLTCEKHGTFTMCKWCKAPQLESHVCLFKPKPIEPKPPKAREDYKKRRPYRLRTDEANGVCCICGNALAKRGPQGQIAEFCMEHQKYKHRVFYYMKRAATKLSKDDAMKKVIAEAKQEIRVMQMLHGQESDIVTATNGDVAITAVYNARDTTGFVGPPGGSR